jgi:hypothetical protein
VYLVSCLLQSVIRVENFESLSGIAGKNNDASHVANFLVSGRADMPTTRAA